MKPEVRILVGPIASGKSTYAREASRQGLVIVNDDAIVEALHAGQYGHYSPRLKRLYKAVETAIITTALAMGESVVIDRPCHLRATRTRYVELAHAFDAKATAVVFPRELPEVHALRRFQSDPRGHDLAYWTRIARVHEDRFEPINYLLERFDNTVEIPQREEQAA